jgi:prophage tail gpP-like protein
MLVIQLMKRFLKHVLIKCSIFFPNIKVAEAVVKQIIELVGSYPVRTITVRF